MQRKPKKAKGFSAAWLHRGCIITVFGKPDWLFRLADVPFLALRHPGVGGADIRVSTVTRPGCRHVQHPGVVQPKTVKKRSPIKEEGKPEQDFRHGKRLFCASTNLKCQVKTLRACLNSAKHSGFYKKNP